MSSKFSATLNEFQVKSQFPALFKKGNIEQRVFLAKRLVLITHASRRKAWLRSMKENQNTSEEVYIHSLKPCDMSILSLMSL